MPRIDVPAVAAEERTTYPPEYAVILKGRSKKKLGDAAGLTQFGVNLTRLNPGAASSHRHWHKNEDEFVFILEGEAVLIEDGGETLLRPGDAAGFKAGVATGHQIVNRSEKEVVFLEVGSRADEESVTYTDAKIDLKAVKEDGRWKVSRRDGSPF